MKIQRDEQRDESHVSRQFRVERARTGEGKDAKTVYRVSLSSEAAIRDWPWAPPNILEHGAKSIDLDLAREQGLPLFVNHQMRDIKSLVGRIVNVELVERRLVGELRFSDANPDAEMIRGMVDEGTLTDMSITAEPITRKVIEDVQNKVVKEMRWTRWRPVEGSVVGVGADRAVGIGRQVDPEGFQSPNVADTVSAHAPALPTNIGRAKMDGDENLTPEQKAAKEAAEVAARAEQEAKDKVTRARASADENFAVKKEEARQKAIRDLGTINKIGRDTVEEWVARGYSVEQVTGNLLEIFKSRGETKPDSVAMLGLTDGETRRYSVCRAILAAKDNNWKDAGFEGECHRAIQDKYPTRVLETGAFFVPLEVQRRALPTDIGALLARHQGVSPMLQRDLQVAGTAGYTVGTSIVGFDQLLRNISFAFRMGVTRLTGLRDNITIPRQTAAATAEWLQDETDSAAETQPTFTQLPMTPKTVSAYTEMSRLLLMQSSLDVEGLVNADLAAVVALAADVAVLSGNGGTGQPLGLDNVTGVGTVSGASLGLAGVLESQTDVATANVMPVRGGYVTTPTVAALMIAEVAFANTASPLWGDPNGGDGPGNIWEGRMLGFPALSTNQVGAGLMYFGDWTKAVVAEWGILEIQTNPYANFPQGVIGVRAMYSLDVGIRLPAAFSITSSIT